MKKSEIKKDAEFNKYERNLLKAEALQTVGQYLEQELKNAEEELQINIDYLNTRYDELMAEHTDDDEITHWDVDWKIGNARRDVEKARMKIALWKKTVALIDKELG